MTDLELPTTKLVFRNGELAKPGKDDAVLLRQLFLALLILSQLSVAIADSEDAGLIAERLFDGGHLIDTEEMAWLLAEQKLAADPALEPYAELVVEHVRDIVTDEEIKSKIVEFYASRFTVEELRRIEEFMTDPAIIKLNRQTPEIGLLFNTVFLQMLEERSDALEERVEQVKASAPGHRT